MESVPQKKSVPVAKGAHPFQQFAARHEEGTFRAMEKLGRRAMEIGEKLAIFVAGFPFKKCPGKHKPGNKGFWGNPLQ